ncbi:MAG: DUF4491 family protein [Eubacterium sp.]|nr:DUF4491 family protein [Eubacterium sp.]
MNPYGLLIAAIIFVEIGIFHPLVIKAEYYFSKRCWPVFLLVGIISIIFSLMVESVFVSIILGSLGCTSLWSILELFHQEKRVLRGQFPMNPKRIEQSEEKKSIEDIV